MSEFQPGEPAPHTGDYHELNVLGGWTGKIAFLKEGEAFPSAPRAFVWQPLSERPPAELRARAREYRSKAETAATPGMVLALRELADRLEEMAARRTDDLSSDLVGSGLGRRFSA